MSKVIVFGSLNMDLSIACERMPQAGETLTGEGFLVNPGGKGANQAVAAAQLGAPVVMVGAVGADAFGEQLAAGLARAGVDCAHVSRLSSVTTGVAVIIRSAGDNRIVLDSGANHALAAADVSRALDEVAKPGDVFLTQLECDVNTTWAALASAHARGLYTMFNPAPARAVPRAAWANVDLVCLNETECEIITGTLPVDEDSACRAMELLASWGPETVALTLGAKGSLVLSAGELVASVPPAIEAIDTTGAGDTYIGALAAGAVRGTPLREIVARATCASALACTRVGAQQAVPTAAEVDRALAR